MEDASLHHLKLYFISHLIFNLILMFLLQILGSIIIIAGIVIQVAYRQYLDFLDHSIFSIPVLLIRKQN